MYVFINIVTHNLEGFCQKRCWDGRPRNVSMSTNDSLNISSDGTGLLTELLFSLLEDPSTSLSQLLDKFLPSLPH